MTPPLTRLRAWTAVASLILLATGCCDLEITTNALPDGIVGEPYAFGLDSDCGGDAWFLTSFDLPPGIGLQSDGDLVGVPSLPGIFTFTVAVVDYGSNQEAFQAFTLTVRPAVPTS